jgi:hypothetical protein
LLRQIYSSAPTQKGTLNRIRHLSKIFEWMGSYCAQEEWIK